MGLAGTLVRVAAVEEGCQLLEHRLSRVVAIDLVPAGIADEPAVEHGIRRPSVVPNGTAVVLVSIAVVGIPDLPALAPSLFRVLQSDVT